LPHLRSVARGVRDVSTLPCPVCGEHGHDGRRHGPATKRDGKGHGVPDVPLDRVRRSLTIAVDTPTGAWLARKKWRQWFGDETFPYPTNIERPLTRGDCQQDTGRPCPWVSCAFHLYLDVNPLTGSLTLNFPELAVDEMPATCALDVADDGGKTLDETGRLVNLTRERIRQYEVVMLRKIKAAADGELGLSSDSDRDQMAAAG